MIVTTSSVFIPYESWIEAGGLVAPMRTALSTSGEFVHVPNGASPGGSAANQFGLQQNGNYHIWGLTSSPSSDDNSFLVTVDGGAQLAWDTPIGSEWVYDRVSHRGSGDATYQPLGGWHELVIERGEDGTRLNRILITNDVGFVPRAIAPNLPAYKSL